MLYPNEEVLRDYLSWRQADCHINNLYNTTFHALIKHKEMTPAEAEKHLCKSVSSDKVRLNILPKQKLKSQFQA